VHRAAAMHAASAKPSRLDGALPTDDASDKQLVEAGGVA
jgi:hypothetical protein